MELDILKLFSQNKVQHIMIYTVPITPQVWNRTGGAVKKIEPSH